MTIEKSMLVIANHVSEIQCSLDLVAREARSKHEIALRNALIEGVADGPELVVCQTLAEEISIGRDDGYPTINLSEDVKKVLNAAVASGILKVVDTNRILVGSVKLYHDFSGIPYSGSAESAKDADIAAYMAALDYRRKNKR